MGETPPRPTPGGQRKNSGRPKRVRSIQGDELDHADRAGERKVEPAIELAFVPPSDGEAAGLLNGISHSTELRAKTGSSPTSFTLSSCVLHERIAQAPAFPVSLPLCGGADNRPDRYGYGTTLPDGLPQNAALQQQFILTFLQRVSTLAADLANLGQKDPDGHPPDPLYIVSALREFGADHR